MKEILTEFDLLQEAMKKINMNEVAMPIHNGKIVENKECYCKMQQILDAPEMIKSHAFILNLDPEQLEEDEIERVDQLWNLGVNRGFITPDGDEKTDNEIVTGDIRTVEPQPEEKAPESSFSYKTQKVDVPCWTVLYSATDKNGDIKTGECYSNAINTRSAKADCYAKLERCGYSSISILAIEAGDPDNCGNDRMILGKDGEKSANVACEATKENEVEEADTSFDDLNSAHASGTKEKVTYAKDGEQEVEVAGPTDDEKAAEGADYKTLYSEFLTAADDYQQIADLQGENSVAAKNAFKEVQGAYEDCYAAVPSAADERELLSQVNTYGFKLAGDNCTILEGEEELVDESGNPYLAGMKTTDLNGQMKVSTKGPAKPKKDSAKKTKIDEEDDDSSDDSDSDDSGDDSESEDTSSDDSSEDTDDDSDSSSDDNSDDDSSDDNSEDDSDSDDEDPDDSDDSSSDEDSDSGDDEDSDDSDDDNSDDDSGEDDSDKDDEDDSDEDDSEDEESDDEDDDSDDDDDDSDNKEESKEDLSDEEKAQYKSDYKKTFKDIMLKCKFEDKCFDDLSIAEKVEFFTKLQKVWKKNEPKDFMSDKEIEQLNKVVVKK